MSRYVDADDYRKKWVDIFDYAYGDRCCEMFKKSIDDQPTADVVEINRGYWKGKPIAGYCTVRCSVCGSAFLDNDGKWNYCPNCGADMRDNND